MSLSPFSLSTKLSERLTQAKTRELAGAVLKAEHPHPSPAAVSPLLELVCTLSSISSYACYAVCGKVVVYE